MKEQEKKYIFDNHSRFSTKITKVNNGRDHPHREFSSLCTHLVFPQFSLLLSVFIICIFGSGGSFVLFSLKSVTVQHRVKPFGASSLLSLCSHCFKPEQLHYLSHSEKRSSFTVLTQHKCSRYWAYQ